MAKHSLIFVRHSHDRPGIWRQSGRCTCGEKLETSSTAGARGARQNLRRNWELHVERADAAEGNDRAGSSP